MGTVKLLSSLIHVCCSGFTSEGLCHALPIWIFSLSKGKAPTSFQLHSPYIWVSCLLPLFPSSHTFNQKLRPELLPYLLNLSASMKPQFYSPSPDYHFWSRNSPNVTNSFIIRPSTHPSPKYTSFHFCKTTTVQSTMTMKAVRFLS